MYIRKQRLLTPGPTPLYPPALHAMMASDIHHRTEDFRKVYRSVLADLKEVMGTSQRCADVRRLRHRSHGCFRLEPVLARRQSDRLLSRKVRRALGRNRQSLRPGRQRAFRRPTAKWCRPSSVEAALAAEPGDQGRVRAGFGNLHRRGARRSRHGPRRRQDRRHLRGGRHHRPGHHAARYRRLGARRGHRRFAESLHDSAGPGVYVGQPEGLEAAPKPPRCRTTTST